MRTALIVTCSLALVCGCGKKTRPTQPSADNSPVAPGSPPVTQSRPPLPPGWVEFRHPDDAFTVFVPFLPTPPKGAPNASLRQPVPTGQALVSEHVAEGVTGVGCRVVVAVYSPEFLGAAPASFARMDAGPNKTSSSVTWCGRPAVEVVEKQPTGGRTIYGRRVFIGDRMYAAFVWGSADGQPTAAERAAFFDSFAPAR